MKAKQTVITDLRIHTIIFLFTSSDHPLVSHLVFCFCFVFYLLVWFALKSNWEKHLVLVILFRGLHTFCMNQEYPKTDATRPLNNRGNFHCALAPKAYSILQIPREDRAKCTVDCELL